MQKSLLAATLAALFGMGGTASAADVYSGGSTKDGPVPLYAPVTSWTGFYAGVNAGYAWGNDSTLSAFACEYCFREEDPFDAGRTKLSPAGGFGGGQIGYNWQSGRFVFGIEADIQGGDISDTASLSLLGGDAFARAASRLDWFGTLRGRLGYAADNWLFYGTGGFAYGGVRDTLSVTSPWGDTSTVGKSEVRTGYVVGGGVEYKLNPSWSLKGEYQFIDLGRDRLSATAGDECAWATASLKADHTYNTVRVGLNYHFGETYQPLK
jgi:outer membrane immunogenic protein